MSPRTDDEPLVLHGRSRECDVIDELLCGARCGRGGAVVLRSEAGMGKSALLEYAGVRARPANILRARGVQTESDMAYAGLESLVGPVLAHLELLPEVRSVALKVALGLLSGPVQRPFLVASGLLGLLSQAADSGPVCALVDDVQWLDPESVAALAFVARRIEADSISILFTVRDDGPESDDALALLSKVPSVSLAPLAPADAQRLLLDARLLTGLDGHQDDPLGVAVIEHARGNPLALKELAAENAWRRAGELSGLSELSLSARLEEIYCTRVAALPRPAQEFLLLAALSESADQNELHAASRLLDLDDEAMDVAVLSRLVHVVDGAIEFAHPLVRSAVVAGTTRQRSRRAHEALAVACPDPRSVRAVWHRAHAAVAPNELVADELVAVATVARDRGASASAATALEMAAVMSSRSPVRSALLIDAAETSWECGRRARARQLLDQARELGESADAGRVDHLRGRIEVHCGSVTSGYEMLVRGALRTADTSPGLSAAMLLDAERAAGYDADVPRIMEVGRHAAELLETTPGPLPAADFVSGVAALFGGSIDTAMPLLRRAATSITDEADPSAFVRAAKAQAYLGDLGSARRAATTAVALARAQGALGTLATALEVSSFAELAISPSAAESDATEGLRLAEETAQSPCAAMHLSTLATIRAYRGDEVATVELTERVFALAAVRGHAFPELRARLALAVLDLSLGRSAQALDRLAHLMETTRHPAVVLAGASDLVEAAARAGAPERGLPALHILERWASALGSPLAEAIVMRSRALVDPDSDHATSLWDGALERLRGYGESLDLARTQLLYGERLRRGRRRIDARPHLRSAWDTFARLGALPWAERARAELRATGESARSRRSSPAVELTPQELQVAVLVAEGGSSKDVAAHLFLSPRTVDYHLRKVYAKTGISSRAELRNLDLGG